MSYWKLPAEVIDNRDELLDWVKKAVKVSRTVAKLKK